MLWYLYAHRNATEEFWKQIELPNGADEIYVCIGVKASNYFMPAETLSDKGPGRLRRWPGGEGWVSWTIYEYMVLKQCWNGDLKAESLASMSFYVYLL